MGVARRLLERISRHVTLRRHLPRAFGGAPMWVTPGAGLGFWRWRLQSDLFAFVDEFVRPGDVVWDIGANVGLLSVAAAQRAGAGGEVFAVEADLWLAALLRRSARLQGPAAAAIAVLPAAVYSSLGVAQFQLAKRSRATNHLAAAGGSSQTGGVRETVQVVTVTLDWLLAQCRAPQVVKIDVEGAEADVLRGAAILLATARPVVLCEVYAENAAAVTEMLTAQHYTLFDWDVTERMPVVTATYNTLAIPAERCSS